MKKLTTLLALSLGMAAHAQDAQPTVVVQVQVQAVDTQPTTTQMTEKDFSKLNIADVLSAGDLPDLNIPKENLSDSVLHSMRFIKPETTEGVAHGPLPEGAHGEVFSSKDAISDVLEQAPLESEQIKYYLKQAKTIVRRSGTNMNEEITRMTLNRAVDAFGTVLPKAGSNSEEIRNISVSLLQRFFEIAGEYAQSPCQFDRHNFAEEVRDFRLVPYPVWGLKIATLLQTNSQTLERPTAEATSLILAEQYLGQDIYHDISNRDSNQDVQALLSEIYELQRSDEMKGILETMRAGDDPTSRQNAWLRTHVDRIIKRADRVYNPKL
jgi:hypothetical protein